MVWQGVVEHCIYQINYHLLVRRYKNVSWSKTQNTWIYCHNRLVNFTVPQDQPEPTPKGPTPAHTLTPSEEQDSEDENELKRSSESQQKSEQNTFTDEAQVTNIFDRTVEALTQVTTFISQHSTPQIILMVTINNRWARPDSKLDHNKSHFFCYFSTTYFRDTSIYICR